MRVLRCVRDFIVLTRSVHCETRTNETVGRRSAQRYTKTAINFVRDFLIRCWYRTRIYEADGEWSSIL